MDDHIITTIVATAKADAAVEALPRAQVLAPATVTERETGTTMAGPPLAVSGGVTAAPLEPLGGVALLLALRHSWLPVVGAHSPGDTILQLHSWEWEWAWEGAWAALAVAEEDIILITVPIHEAHLSVPSTAALEDST